MYQRNSVSSNAFQSDATEPTDKFDVQIDASDAATTTDLYASQTRSLARNRLGQPVNLSLAERVISVILGIAILLLTIRKRLLIYIGLAIVAIMLLHRSISGHSRLYERMSISGWYGMSPPSDSAAYTSGSAFADEASGSASGDSARQTSDSKTPGPEEMHEQVQSEVDEASLDSFPASDPPSNW